MSIRKKLLLDVILVLFFVFSSLLVIFEYLSHTNFVLNTFRVDYANLFILSITLIIVRLLIEFRLNISKLWQKIIFYAPIFLIIFSLIIFMKRHDLFLYFEEEDSLIETLQVVLLVSSSILSAILAKLFWNKNRLLSFIFVILALGFFFVGGEEISWGQRIFDIKTPEEYAKLNTQGEITLHNYGPAFEYVYKAYAIIGFMGSFLWTIKNFIIKKVKKPFKKIIKTLIPDWQYMFYFLVAFFYNLEIHVLHPRTGAHLGNALWEEPMELLLFLGVTIFLTELLIRKIKNVES